jgi:hypothetical protein
MQPNCYRMFNEHEQMMDIEFLTDIMTHNQRVSIKCSMGRVGPRTS